MIKDWEKMSPAKWKRTWVEKSEKKKSEDYFDFGSLVDCLLFTPDLFDDNFIITKIKIPAVAGIVDRIYEMHSEQQAPLKQIGFPVRPKILNDFHEEILQIAKLPEFNYGKGEYKPERVIKEIVAKGSEYFDKKCEVGGKIIITTEDNIIAMDRVDVLRKDPRSRPYFVEQEGETLLFQQEIFVPLREYSFLPFFAENDMAEHILYKKGALDIIRIDHIAMTIENPDFKTSYDASKNNFIRHIKKLKYGIQASYYRRLLEHWAAENYPGYRLLPPFNIAIDRIVKAPMFYRYDTSELSILEKGHPDFHGREVSGWQQSLDEITWHIENNVWDNCREMTEQGFIDVHLFA